VNQPPSAPFGRDVIESILPHRAPFLLLDEVTELEPGRRVVARREVRADDWWFPGHFPERPVMPGVLIVEAMAQCAAILGLRDMPDREKKLFLFGGVDKARFRRPVVPGDQLRLECVVLHRRSTSVKINGKATVDGQLVAEAELFSVLIDRPE
jgi:3-hydroxyacyl-[acyl-carrier-protein] dehydratase